MVALGNRFMEVIIEISVLNRLFFFRRPHKFQIDILISERLSHQTMSGKFFLYKNVFLKVGLFFLMWFMSTPSESDILHCILQSPSFSRPSLNIPPSDASAPSCPALPFASLSSLEPSSSINVFPPQWLPFSCRDHCWNPLFHWSSISLSLLLWLLPSGHASLQYNNYKLDLN